MFSKAVIIPNYSREKVPRVSAKITVGKQRGSKGKQVVEYKRENESSNIVNKYVQVVHEASDKAG